MLVHSAYPVLVGIGVVAAAVILKYMLENGKKKTKKVH